MNFVELNRVHWCEDCRGTRHRYFGSRGHRTEWQGYEKRHFEFYRSVEVRRLPDRKPEVSHQPPPRFRPVCCFTKAGGGDRVEQMTVMRKKIAEHMVLRDDFGPCHYGL